MRGMKSVVEFEWKVNGWVFHLKLILPLPTILIVNWWKFVLSGVNAKKKKKTKRRNRIFPFYFLIFQSYVVLKITRSRRLVALNVYGYYRCQYLNVLYVRNTTLTSCFMFRNLKWLYHFVTRNVKRGWGGRVCYFYSKMFLVFSEHLKWFCTCPNIHSIHFQKRIIFI